jgi:hypothetical protein
VKLVKRSLVSGSGLIKFQTTAMDIASTYLVMNRCTRTTGMKKGNVVKIQLIQEFGLTQILIQEICNYTILTPPTPPTPSPPFCDVARSKAECIDTPDLSCDFKVIDYESCDLRCSCKSILSTTLPQTSPEYDCNFQMEHLRYKCEMNKENPGTWIWVNFDPTSCYGYCKHSTTKKPKKNKCMPIAK